jgi:hypothetical protein
MFTAEYLCEMRKKALRKGVWYRTLNRVERGIISLTARIVYRVDSRLLGEVLMKILSKLMNAMKSEFVRRVGDFGFRRARELSKQAAKWGCNVVISWASELNFVRYLAMMSLNELNGFGF